MIRGTVISFDRIKGYGFVSPDAGGDDVFIHVNDLFSDKSLLTAGCTVEFRLDEGARGPKASDVTVVGRPDGSAAAAASGAAAAASVPRPRGEPAGEETCDVLTAGEFEHEVTELLLRVEPELGGPQILEIRKRLLRVAQSHGWCDN